MSLEDKYTFLAYNPPKQTYDFILEPEASSSHTVQAVPVLDTALAQSPSAVSSTSSVALPQTGAAGPIRSKTLCPRVRHFTTQGLSLMAVGNCVTVPTQSREGGWSIQTIGYLQSNTGVTFRTQLIGMLSRYSAWQKQKAEQAQSMRPGGIRAVQSGARQIQSLPPIRDILPEGFLDSLPRTAPASVPVQAPAPRNLRGPAASGTNEAQQAGAPQAAPPLRSTAKHNARGSASKPSSGTTQIVKGPRGWLKSEPLPQPLPPLIPQTKIYSTTLRADVETPTTGVKQGSMRKQKSSLQTRAKDSII